MIVLEFNYCDNFFHFYFWINKYIYIGTKLSWLMWWAMAWTSGIRTKKSTITYKLGPFGWKLSRARAQYTTKRICGLFYCDLSWYFDKSKWIRILGRETWPKSKKSDFLFYFQRLHLMKVNYFTTLSFFIDVTERNGQAEHFIGQSR